MKQADKCRLYRQRGTREKNKARRIRRHVRRYPGDLAAQQRLTEPFLPRTAGRK